MATTVAKIVSNKLYLSSYKMTLDVRHPTLSVIWVGGKDLSTKSFDICSPSQTQLFIRIP
jgi:hypothetical protein